ncbi:hypothetical protein [Fretibacter rubidus]|uniref:hypothetical protein n=1 Tax=Fretibacter rubidus TaxID=570162 RepID=UPI00352A2E59
MKNAFDHATCQPMTDENPNSPETETYVPRKDRRPSRYVKAQQRRDAAKARDNKFYAAIFSLITMVVLVALLISAVMVNGGAVDTSAMGGWASPWVMGLSKMEVVGLAFVGLVGYGMWRKMKK